MGASVGDTDGDVDGASDGDADGDDGCIQVLVVFKAPVPIVLVILGFQLMHVNGQYKKALSPMVVTLSGMLTYVNDVHPWNVLFSTTMIMIITRMRMMMIITIMMIMMIMMIPMVVTRGGMVIDVNDVQ